MNDRHPVYGSLCVFSDQHMSVFLTHCLCWVITIVVMWPCFLCVFPFQKKHGTTSKNIKASRLNDEVKALYWFHVQSLCVMYCQMNTSVECNYNTSSCQNTPLFNSVHQIVYIYPLFSIFMNIHFTLCYFPICWLLFACILHAYFTIPVASYVNSYQFKLKLSCGFVISCKHLLHLFESFI